jgi:ActR/RegA family two-component response regulator
MVTLTMKEQLKLEVIQRVMDNQIDISNAAQILGLSDRSIYRLLSRVRYYFILGFTPRRIRG